MDTFTTLCTKCKTELKSEDIYCPECGFPEKAEMAEKDKYEYRVKLKHDVLDDARKKLRNVSIMLYILAALNTIMGIFYLSDDSTFNDGIGTLIAAIVFVACALWVKRKPLVGILAAFIFWILLQLSVILVDPTLLIQGALLKVIIIGVFVKGISSARDYKKYSDQLSEMNAN